MKMGVFSYASLT